MKRSFWLSLLFILLLPALVVFPTTARADDDTTPPEITITLSSDVVTRVDTLVVDFSAQDPDPGSGLLAAVGVFNGFPIESGQSLSLQWLPLGTHTVQVAAFDLVGNVGSAEASFTLVATLDSLQANWRLLCQQGYVTRQSLCTVYDKKLDAIIHLYEIGNNLAVKNLLRAVAHDLDIQSHKTNNPGISPVVAEIMLQDINYIVSTLP